MSKDACGGFQVAGEAKRSYQASPPTGGYYRQAVSADWLKSSGLKTLEKVKIQL